MRQDGFSWGLNLVLEILLGMEEKMNGRRERKDQLGMIIYTRESRDARMSQSSNRHQVRLGGCSIPNMSIEFKAMYGFAALSVRSS